MPQFAVSDEKNRWLVRKMEELRLREEDLRESFIRSSGNGGQHVNKTSTAVQLTHIPSGITVSASRERSQSINRFIARRMLIEQLEELQGIVTPEMKRIARQKKQKERRHRRSLKKEP